MLFGHIKDMADIFLTDGTAKQLAKLDYGVDGHEVLVNADGTTTDGVFYYKITALDDSVIDYVENAGGNTYTNVTIDSGTTITGKFDEIAVDSGTIAIYPGEIKFN